MADPQVVTAARDVALKMIAAAYDGFGWEIFARWDGFVGAWSMVWDDEVPAPKFTGLRLTVRTEGRARDAVAECLVTVELIRDDESGEALRMLLNGLTADCERVLATA